MTKKEKDEQFAAHLPGILQYHETMLSDGVRNKLLNKAIKRHINDKTSFLDIGAGTGVWSILAAKLGAKRVVAVEIEEALIPIIFKHAQENGVADKIEIFHGDSNDVKLKGKFDVIVSELFGGDAIGRSTIESFIDVRNRFLAPDGILIPQALSAMAAPVWSPHAVEDIPKGLPINYEFFRSLKLNYPRVLDLKSRGSLKFIADPVSLLDLNFMEVKTAPMAEMSASWRLRDLSKANGIVFFNRSIFSNGIEMNNFLSQSWGAAVYEFEPFSKGPGLLRFDLSVGDEKSIWKISCEGNTTPKQVIFSPTFGPARVRMLQQMTPYRRVRKKPSGKRK
jgi:SAM-dependent methyltransferase